MFKKNLLECEWAWHFDMFLFSNFQCDHNQTGKQCRISVLSELSLNFTPSYTFLLPLTFR